LAGGFIVLRSRELLDEIPWFRRLVLPMLQVHSIFCFQSERSIIVFFFSTNIVLNQDLLLFSNRPRLLLTLLSTLV